MAKKSTPNDMEARFMRVPVAKIKPAKYNPRKELQPGDPEYESIKRSMETHGLAEPLVWNEHNGVLIGGHQRFRVLVNEFKAKTVWCSVRTIKSEKEEISLNIALNKNQGDWDFAKLKPLLFRFAEDASGDPLRAAMGFAPLEFKGILDWAPQMTSPDSLEQTPGQRLGVYLDGAIKQIVLYFDGKDYPSVIKRLENVRTLEKVDDNTSAFLRLLEVYADYHNTKVVNKQKAAR